MSGRRYLKLDEIVARGEHANERGETFSFGIDNVGFYLEEEEAECMPIEDFIADRDRLAADLETALARIEAIAAERDQLAGERKALREALKPFATFRDLEPHFAGDPAPKDLLSDRGSNGTLCMPDSHGYALVWADEHDGDVVDFTAGQLRRARAAYESGGNA